MICDHYACLLEANEGRPRSTKMPWRKTVRKWRTPALDLSWTILRTKIKQALRPNRLKPSQVKEDHPSPTTLPTSPVVLGRAHS